MQEKETAYPKIHDFEFEGTSQPVEFVETTQVVSGVECDVYNLLGDKTKDLGIIRIQPGGRTPPQRVVGGDRTIEGHVSGTGALVVIRTNGNGDPETYKFTDDASEKLSVEVKIGDVMQWRAAENSKLVVYEVCIPPYQDGRYENLQ